MLAEVNGRPPCVGVDVDECPQCVHVGVHLVCACVVYTFCLYSIAIQAKSFHNNMADKTVWWTNRGQINEYSLYLQ